MKNTSKDDGKEKKRVWKRKIMGEEINKGRKQWKKRVIIKWSNKLLHNCAISRHRTKNKISQNNCSVANAVGLIKVISILSSITVLKNFFGSY